jgi:hypothetical protein
MAQYKSTRIIEAKVVTSQYVANAALVASGQMSMMALNPPTSQSFPAGTVLQDSQFIPTSGQSAGYTLTSADLTAFLASGVLVND